MREEEARPTGIMSRGLWKSRRYGFSLVVQAGLFGKWSVLKLGVGGDVAKSENGFGAEVDIKSMKSPW